MNLKTGQRSRILDVPTMWPPPRPAAISLVRCDMCGDMCEWFRPFLLSLFISKGVVQTRSKERRIDVFSLGPVRLKGANKTFTDT